MVKFLPLALVGGVLAAGGDDKGPIAHSLCDMRKVPATGGFVNYGTGDHAGDAIVLECDDCDVDIPLGSMWGFGDGHEYDTLCMSNNAVIALGSCASQANPLGKQAAEQPIGHNLHVGMDLFWCDVHPGRGGNVYWRMADSSDEQFQYMQDAFHQFSPEEILVITWHKAARFEAGECNFGANLQVLVGKTANGQTRWLLTFGSAEWFELEEPTIGWNGPNPNDYEAALNWADVEQKRFQWHHSTGWIERPIEAIVYEFPNNEANLILDQVLRNAGFHDKTKEFLTSNRGRPSSHNNNPYDDVASTMISTLEEYGCWCSAVAHWDAPHGEPFDKIDRACREWNHCKRCTRQDECEVNKADETYSITFDGVHYTCDDNDSCTKEGCECDLDYATRVAREVIDERGDINEENTGFSTAQCPRHVDGVNTGANAKNGCERREERESIEDTEAGDLMNHYYVSDFSPLAIHHDHAVASGDGEEAP